jgi:hypothetical protein
MVYGSFIFRKSLGDHQLPYGVRIDARGSQLWKEVFTQVRVGSGRATVGLGRVVPPAILAEQDMPLQACIKHLTDPIDKRSVGACAAPRDLDVGGNVGIGTGMDPDEAAAGIASRFDNRDLLAHDLAADGVTTNHGAGRGCGLRCGVQDLRFAGRRTVVAGTEFDEASLHAALLDRALQFAPHPVAELILTRRLRPAWHPRFAIDPGGNHQRHAGCRREGSQNIRTASHSDRCTLHDHCDRDRMCPRDLWGHQMHDLRKVCLRVARLIRGPEADEDVLVG